MNLECLNGIITDNLAIQIDLTQLKSWDLNSGFTAFSLTKWSGAVVDNINLPDFGLTEFDNGRTNFMWSGKTLTPADSLFSMLRVGYNVVQNPSTGNTSGLSATTQFDIYPISGITGGTTGGTTGNYFELNGGYLQGFYKLDGYNYELLPARFNNGITVETLLYIHPNSSGIFYMMGLRAEDKYNAYFSGETTTGGTVGDISKINGVNSSEDNYLNAFSEVVVNKPAFSNWETRTKKEYKEFQLIDNIKGNAIAFFLTPDKQLGYKYIDDNGLIVENISSVQISTTGFTMIAVAFTPYHTIGTNNPELFMCAPRRSGKLMFYINGRVVWTVPEFPEYFFRAVKNQKDKQVGVPYSISWGGGSFGLRHSWHYDFQKYGLYTGGDTLYINDNFNVQNNPLPSECETPATDDYLPGLSLSADSTTFYVEDVCDSSIERPVTTMRIEYTGQTETTATTYFVKFNHPVSVLSNRDYVIDMSLFNSGFFKGNGEVNIIIYGTVDIDILDEVEYSNPLTKDDLLKLIGSGLHPFPDRQEYQYIYSDGIMYYGATGIPVALQDGDPSLENLVHGNIVTGENAWKPLKLKFRTKDNSGQQFIQIGILLESTEEFNLNTPLYINNFTYEAADILVQDSRKDNLLIEQNFNQPFIGGIQKLRVYNNGLTPAEILHNAVYESKQNPGFVVNKGGRIIQR